MTKLFQNLRAFDWSQIFWINAIFLIATPILVAISLPLHIFSVGYDWRLLLMFGLSCVATSVSITGGYHRLFAHRSYDSNVLVKFFYLIFGAAAAQGSALKWCSDHRRHHRNVDSLTEDPYTVKRGFFYAHMGWIFFKETNDYRAPDLKKDKLVVWQDKYYPVLVVAVGFGLPTAIGAAMGHAWGGLLYGGFARVLLTHHCTFLINSLCHMWGSQPYGDKTSAKDNFVLAFLTYGEGYHNFHHRFEADYRNGIKWYQWDPTKWLIRSMSYIGFTRNLRKVSDAEILKARLIADEARLARVGFCDETLKELRLKIEESQRKIAQFKIRYQEAKRDFSAQKDEHVRNLRAEMKAARRELKAQLALWRSTYKFNIQTAMA